MFRSDAVNQDLCKEKQWPDKLRREDEDDFGWALYTCAVTCTCTYVKLVYKIRQDYIPPIQK